MVSIRLSRAGAKKRPFYHLVVTQTQRANQGGAPDFNTMMRPIIVPLEVALQKLENTSFHVHQGTVSKALKLDSLGEDVVWNSLIVNRSANIDSVVSTSPDNDYSSRPNYDFVFKIVDTKGVNVSFAAFNSEATEVIITRQTAGSLVVDSFDDKVVLRDGRPTRIEQCTLRPGAPEAKFNDGAVTDMEKRLRNKADE